MADPNRPVPARPSRKRDSGKPGQQEWNKDIKAYYDSVAQEPVPEEFRNLMDSLTKAIRK